MTATEQQFEWVPHTCNPNNPGKPLPFGRKAPEGKCESCDQLRAGRPPREAHPAIKAAQRKRDDEARLSEEIRRHNCVAAGCYRDGFGNIICTAFDW